MRPVLAELKRRHVYRAAAFYAAAGWLLVQVATQVAPYLDLPNWSVRLTIIAVVAGFPVVMLLSWYFEWSPAAGWRRESEHEIADLAALPVSGHELKPPPSDQSIAVLSFVDMSRDKDQEYFSDGLAEELLNLLAQLPQLRVIARTSSFSFKGKDVDVGTIARTLQVCHVLEGSVRKHGDRLRVTAQLIRGSDGSHVWSHTYERELTDVFVVQDEIAQAVVATLKVKLLPEQRLANPHRTAVAEAYEAYLFGQSVLRRGRHDDSQQAVDAFERSLALDPSYAPACAALATAQSAVADYEQDPARRDAKKTEAIAMAERAVAMAPNLADGYVVRARLRLRRLWDWQGAEADLQRALALEPGSIDALLQLAFLLHGLGRAEATATTLNMISLDPLSWLAWLFHGAILRNCGEFAEARIAMRRSLEINPHSSWTRQLLGSVELLEGQPEKALAIFREAGAPYRQLGMAMAEYSLGHKRESDEALAEVEAKYAAGFSLQIAEVHAWRGDKDAAFACLDRALELRDSGIPRMRQDSMYRTLHDDPRWAALLKRLNFPE
jgi:serine/threonine-protein kinase